jgi:hypothetical protein
VIEGFFSVMVFSKIFPNILDEFDIRQRLDVRCGFSEYFLNGKLDEVHVSQISYNKDGSFKYNINFGCGVFVHNKTEENTFSLLMPVATDSEYWTNWRSFFLSFDGSMTPEFKGTKKGYTSDFLFFNFKDIDMNLS